jgi:hypothetical protein
MSCQRAKEIFAPSVSFAPIAERSLINDVLTILRHLLTEELVSKKQLHDVADAI